MTGVKATLLLLLISVQGLCTEVPHELSIAEVLERAETASPDLQAAKARETEGKEAVKILQASYYPSIDFQAIDSWGYPGSNGALEASGLISSPFRIGPGAELVSKLSLFDLSHISGVQTARYNLQVLEEHTQIVRFHTDQVALQIYFEAARYRGEAQVWQIIGLEIEKIAKEVGRFVKTGQHSPVESYLIDDQSEEASIGYETAQGNYLIALHRLALLTGLNEKTIACPSSPELNEASLSVIHEVASSPLLSQAIAASRAAHAAVSERSALNYPKVVALASVGDISRSRFVDKTDYSGGFGLLFPLFQGGQISAEIRQARALAAEKDLDLSSTQLELDELNAQFDESINASQVKLRHLDHEFAMGQKALSLARERYLSFIGPLIEVREALRNLARIETQQADAHADLLLAMGSKALLNGGKAGN